VDADAAAGIAGARLANGRQIFVAGAPLDLEVGIQIRLWWDGIEQTGTVSIPPRLMIWRDPEAPVGRILAVLGSTAPEAAQAAVPPLALFETAGDAPGPQSLAEMLALAHAEMDWLD
jgi:hypothetical protein